jgi:hypothetical protein
MRYPKEWKVVDSKKEGSLWIVPSAIVHPSREFGSSILVRYTFDELVAKNKEKGLSLDEWMNSFALGRNVRGVPHKVDIGNLEAYGLDATNQESDVYIMDEEKRVYLLSTYARNNQDFQILYQILSTFRFTE